MPGGVRFSNSNRIIPSDYRILLLLKMPIPNNQLYKMQLQIKIISLMKREDHKYTIVTIFCLSVFISVFSKEH